MIPYSRQNLNEEDIQAVVSVLRSDFLTQGSVVSEFEQAISNYCQATFSVATSSATAALHVACLALDLSNQDLVWVSAVSFVASANCARYCGADVDFVDIDPSTGLICLKAFEQKLHSATEKPKLLIVVHIAGQSCNMRALAALCKKHQIKIIEDASHALGGRYETLPVGSCRYSDMTVFSFHPVKTITSGEGGMITTNNPEHARLSRLYASHGIERDDALFLKEKPGDWYYEQQVLGFNYRLSDIHAALGLSQLKRIDSMVAERQALANAYREKLAGLPVSCLAPEADSRSAWHLFIIRVEPSIRTSLFHFLRGEGYGVNLHYMPIPSQPYYESLGLSQTNFPQAKGYADSAISLPLYDGMNLDVVDAVTRVLHRFFQVK